MKRQASEHELPSPKRQHLEADPEADESSEKYLSSNLPILPAKLTCVRYEWRATFEAEPIFDQLYSNTVSNLSNMGPIFRGQNGEPTSFNDLDGFRMMGILTCTVRPIDNRQEYIRNMPKGRWSEYQGSIENTRRYDSVVPMKRSACVENPSISTDAALAMIDEAIKEAADTEPAPEDAHDRVLLVQREPRMFARVMPGLESHRHRIKRRPKLEELLEQDLMARGKSVLRGTLGFTPGPADGGRRGNATVEDWPVGTALSPWVNERLVGSGSLKPGEVAGNR